MIYIGQMNSPAKIAGVGMGRMIQNFAANSILYGFTNALGTFVSQAAGAGKKETCGLYLNRARFIILLLTPPIVVFLMNTKSILIWSG